MMSLGDCVTTEKASRAEKGSPEIVYKLGDKSISLKNAPAQYIGNVLLNIPRLVYAVASSTEGPIQSFSRRSKEFDALYSLNVRFEDGCVEMGFFNSFPEPSTEESEAQFAALNKASKFISLLSRRDLEYNELKLELENEIADLGLRIVTLNSFKQLLPPKGTEAIIKFKNMNGNPDIKLHDEILKRKIDRLLKEEMKNHEFEEKGVITRIKDDVPFPHFTIKNYSGKTIKVKLTEEKRSEIVEFLAKRTPIRLTGVETKKKNFKIVELDEIEQNDHILIDSVNDMKLSEPIEAKLSLDKYNDESEYWVVGNDEFGAYGVDSTVVKAQEMFKEDLYSQYVTYKDIDDDKLSNKALDLKRKLIGLFGNN